MTALKPGLALWQVDIIHQKLEATNKQMFSLEVDLRVARRVGNTDNEQAIIGMIKQVEAVRLALEEELNG